MVGERACAADRERAISVWKREIEEHHVVGVPSDQSETPIQSLDMIHFERCLPSPYTHIIVGELDARPLGRHLTYENVQEHSPQRV